MVDAAQFRLDLPEFTDDTQFPTPIITSFLDLAYIMLNGRRWGTTLDWGAERFAAHHIVLYAVAQRAVDVDGLPGLARGAISSEGAAGVIAGYSTEATKEPDAGHWNYTVYGQIFIHMARLMGAGGMQVSGSFLGALSGASAWAGPPVWNLAWYNN